jgi:putative peptide zinc metalloprotease protein
LLGVPCLYCDVSDAWMMPQRFKRIFISAAGMIAELGIAAIATLLWFWTGDAELREWWLVVMVVCSVSTVIVNGNPLMRYDGYFILSDLVGIPNLASQASTTLRSIVRRWLWGELGNEEPSQQRKRFGLATYAVLSGCYRTMVLSLFTFAVYQFTSSHAFMAVGILFAAVMAKSVLAPAAKSILTPPRLFFRSQEGSKRSIVFGIIALATVLLLWVPLPRSIVAPMTIGPYDSQEIFLNVGGRLLAAVPEASRLRTGDPIANFYNPVLADELLDAETRLEQLVTEEKSLIGSRATRADVAAQLLATVTARQSMGNRVELLRAEVKKLTLTAPREGILIFPTEQITTHSDTSAFESWSRSPLCEDNIGAWIEPGTMVGILGDKERREAILMVEQRSASLIKIGQAVDLLRPSVDGDKWSGEVIEVGSTPVVECPTELLTTGLIPLDSSRDESGKRVPRDTLYQVRVQLKQASVSLPIRTTGAARVRVESASIWSRVSRSFLQSFRL